jgi:D-3-phosphoglycerate dehydrogenase / 2-oxoglutarate reductase
VHRVLVSDKLAPEGLRVLEEAAATGEISFDSRPGLNPAELIAAIGDYEALIVRSGTTVTAEVVAAAPRLRAIGRAGIGVDNIDVEAATRRGIAVMNTPGGNNVTTAEHAISMMLALARSIPQATASMRAGKWEKSKFTGSEISNKVLGLVGIGNIGKLVAERGRGLKMKVIAHDPFITEDRAAEIGVELYPLDDLLARADFISLHVPLTPDTRNLIDAEELRTMKKGARLINCARGGIVNEAALAEALASGHLAGAALDVFEHEPPPADNPLLALDNVICTPHLGAATTEAQVNVAVAVAEQIVDFLVRDVTSNAVNVPSVSAEQLEVLRPYLKLGEKLGSLQAQLLEQAPTEVKVEYGGEVATVDVQPVTVAVLHGMLDRLLEANTVNYVNARELARERGIKITESKTTQTSGYVNQVKVSVTTADKVSEVVGAVFGREVVRLVRVDQFHLEAVPEGHILMLHNRDVPGVVGAVGTLLGEAKVNIAGLELGREAIGGIALSLVHVDDAVPEAILERLRSLPEILSADLLEL